MNKFTFLCIILIFFIPSTVLAAADRDQDGLNDDEEMLYLTDPDNPDSDGDGFFDGVEVAKGYSPLQGDGTMMHQHDADGDGLIDWVERWFNSKLDVADSDGDGYDDATEVMHGFDPASSNPTKRFFRDMVVDLSTQQLAFYVDGIKIESYPVSTGNPNTPTPEGTFSITRKVDLKDYRGADYFVPDVKWNMEFLPMYYIHGAYWHNDFGHRTHSHGCINLRNEDAAYLYRFIDKGFSFTVTGTTPSKYRVGT